MLKLIDTQFCTFFLELSRVKRKLEVQKTSDKEKNGDDNDLSSQFSESSKKRKRKVRKTGTVRSTCLSMSGTSSDSDLESESDSCSEAELVEMMESYMAHEEKMDEKWRNRMEKQFEHDRKLMESFTTQLCSIMKKSVSDMLSAILTQNQTFAGFINSNLSDPQSSSAAAPSFVTDPEAYMYVHPPPSTFFEATNLPTSFSEPSSSSSVFPPPDSATSSRSSSDVQRKLF